MTSKEQQEQQLWLDMALLNRIALMEELIRLLLGHGNDEAILALCTELWPEGDGPWERTEEDPEPTAGAPYSVIGDYMLTQKRRPRDNGCRSFWGTHGCYDHDEQGNHWCDCCTCKKHPDEDSGCVAGPPYYGEDTSFYGEDAVGADNG